MIIIILINRKEIRIQSRFYLNKSQQEFCENHIRIFSNYENDKSKSHEKNGV